MNIHPFLLPQPRSLASRDGRFTLPAAAIKPISAEATGVFTGMILALYATGNGRAADTPADFDWVLQAFQ